MINPVVGIDVSKGNSQGQAFLDKISHIKKLLFSTYRRNRGGKWCTISYYFSGHYHQPVVQAVENHEYLLMLVNPLISQRAIKAHPRKIKTSMCENKLVRWIYAILKQEQSYLTT